MVVLHTPKNKKNNIKGVCNTLLHKKQFYDCIAYAQKQNKIKNFLFRSKCLF